MHSEFSSAGLLYVYLNGYEEDGMLYIQQIDSYRDIEEGLYDKIMEATEFADSDDDFIHIFAVVGLKGKADLVFSIIEEGVKLNFQNILSGKNIKVKTQKLDRVGNLFFRCVQEFYCSQPNHFPKRIYREYDDIVFGGICCSSAENEMGDSTASAIISLWMKRENPMICGKQLMTKSFFMRDFIGRKVIASLPEAKSDCWRLVFEGGHQLYLDEDILYTKETLHPDDVGTFTMSNIQSILLNPIYAYGKWFQPNDICEEWHKVFLYLCAVSDIDWEQVAIREVYEKFLKFMEENICVTMKASPMISKDQFDRILNTHISNFRGFLKGEDEPVISKDLHQTLNSRYVYLPYLWALVKPMVSKGNFSALKLQNLMKQALSEKDVYTKGILWEEVAAYILSNIEGWKITGRRFKAGAQEIDLSLVNISLDNALWKLGAYILVECKNWNTRVGIQQIRNIAHISNMKGNKTAILFAAEGITTDAQAEIDRLSRSNLSIICITANDLQQIDSAEDCKDLILKQWEKLQDDKNELTNVMI